MPGVGSMANLFRGEKELEAEYFAWRQKHGSQGDQTFLQEGKNWRQNTFPGVGSMANLFTEVKDLEAEFHAWRHHHVSKTDQTFVQEGKN